MGGHPGLKKGNLKSILGPAWKEGSLACGETQAWMRNVEIILEMKTEEAQTSPKVRELFSQLEVSLNLIWIL